MKRTRSPWVCGWDIGGAHLKWALRDPQGGWIAVRQSACPLWKGVDQLADALARTVREWPIDAREVHHVATMTGELVDAFSDRSDGVRAIVDCSEAAFAGATWRWFGLDGTLADVATVRRSPLRFASANWLASAVCAAHRSDGLFVDVGSTTTDIIALAGGLPRPRAWTDGERLSVGELVYRGMVRTPLMAVVAGVDWRGAHRPLMAEHFATSADVFRLLGQLEESADVWPAADGAIKTVEGSARRIARLIGEDLDAAALADWQAVAGQFAEALMATLEGAARQTLAEAPAMRSPHVVCAGVGHRLAAQLAARLGWPVVDFAGLVGAQGVPGAREHAPATALTELAGLSANEHPLPG